MTIDKKKKLRRVLETISSQGEMADLEDREVTKKTITQMGGLFEALTAIHSVLKENGNGKQFDKIFKDLNEGLVAIRTNTNPEGLIRDLKVVSSKLEELKSEFKSKNKEQAMLDVLLTLKELMIKANANLDFLSYKYMGIRDTQFNRINPAIKTNNAISGGNATISNSGTAVQISSSSLPCNELIISAPVSNSGTVYVGGSNVKASSANGVPLLQGMSVTLRISDANLVYVDSTSSGDTINFVKLNDTY